jgi:hypothetical protein
MGLLSSNQLAGFTETLMATVPCGPAGCLTDSAGLYGCDNQMWHGTTQCIWAYTNASTVAPQCAKWDQCRAFYCHTEPACAGCSPPRVAGTWCFARSTAQVEGSGSDASANAFVKSSPTPPPAPGPPTPVDAWADKVACDYVASSGASSGGGSACNGWTGSSPAACVAKCRANALPAGCPQDPGFRCAFAQWEPSETDAARCQVAAKNCTPVADPDIWHPGGPSGQGWTQDGANLWKMTSCVLKPGEPASFGPVCAEMANKTACTAVSQTCEWDEEV